MMDFLQSTLGAVLDRSTRELLGGVCLALVLSMGMTGLFALGRRKVGEQLSLLIGLMLVANVASMVLAVGYIAHLERLDTVSMPANMTFSPPDMRRPHPGGPGNGLEIRLSQRIFDLADRDKDGALTPEEASAAGSEFVRRTLEANGQGRLDVTSMATALRAEHLIGPPHLPGRSAGPRLMETGPPVADPEP
jgi:hypothetical protein